MTRVTAGVKPAEKFWTTVIKTPRGFVGRVYHRLGDLTFLEHETRPWQDWRGIRVRGPGVVENVVQRGREKALSAARQAITAIQVSMERRGA